MISRSKRAEGEKRAPFIDPSTVPTLFQVCGHLQWTSDLSNRL